jgi:cytochrome c553
MAAIKGSHHPNDAVLKFGTISEAGQGGTTALSYRFLLGVKGGEETNWMGSGPSNTVHNEYKGATARGAESTISSPGGGTISGLCAECHGNFHGPGTGDIGTAEPWLRHPTDIVMPGTGEYNYYNSSAGGGAANYNIDAPVARVTIPNSIVSTTTTGTDDSIVMCLSCHKAHATANADILRWNYEDINAGGGQENARCFICHTQKDI